MYPKYLLFSRLYFGLSSTIHKLLILIPSLFIYKYKSIFFTNALCNNLTYIFIININAPTIHYIERLLLFKAIYFDIFMIWFWQIRPFIVYHIGLNRSKKGVVFLSWYSFLFCFFLSNTESSEGILLLFYKKKFYRIKNLIGKKFYIYWFVE